jgi:hypothetical protein
MLQQKEKPFFHNSMHRGVMAGTFGGVLWTELTCISNSNKSKSSSIEDTGNIHVIFFFENFVENNEKKNFNHVQKVSKIFFSFFYTMGR